MDTKNIIDKASLSRENTVTELCIFFCGHKLHPKCLETKVSSMSTNLNEGSKDSLFLQQSKYLDNQTDVCPLCFERQAVKSAVKTAKKHTTLLSPLSQRNKTLIASSMHSTTSLENFLTDKREKNPFFS